MELVYTQLIVGSSPISSLFWSYSEMVITSVCQAEGPSSILGNSVKDVYCMFYMVTVAQFEELWFSNVRKNTHLVFAEDTHSNF